MEHYASEERIVHIDSMFSTTTGFFFFVRHSRKCFMNKKKMPGNLASVNVRCQMIGCQSLESLNTKDSPGLMWFQIQVIRLNKKWHQTKNAIDLYSIWSCTRTPASPKMSWPEYDRLTQENYFLGLCQTTSLFLDWKSKPASQSVKLSADGLESACCRAWKSRLTHIHQQNEIDLCVQTVTYLNSKMEEVPIWFGTVSDMTDKEDVKGRLNQRCYLDENHKYTAVLFCNMIKPQYMKPGLFTVIGAETNLKQIWMI